MPPAARQRCEFCVVEPAAAAAGEAGEDPEAPAAPQAPRVAEGGDPIPELDDAPVEEQPGSGSTPPETMEPPSFCYGGGCGCAVCGVLIAVGDEVPFVNCNVCRAMMHRQCAVLDEVHNYCSPNCLWTCEFVANPAFCPQVSAAVELQLERRLRALPEELPCDERLEAERQLRHDAVVSYFTETALCPAAPFLAPMMPIWFDRDQAFLLEMMRAQGQAKVLCMLRHDRVPIGSKLVLPKAKVLAEQVVKQRQSARYLQQPWQREAAALLDEWSACPDVFAS